MREYSFGTTVSVIFFLSSSIAYSQNYRTQLSKGEVWEKRVGRTIFWPAKKEKIARHFKDLQHDSTVFQMIVNSVMSYDVPAFDPRDFDFGSRLSRRELRELLGDKTDTIHVLDPISGEEVVSSSTQYFDEGSVKKYRLMESWKFNSRRNKTKISVVGLMPMAEVYDFSGYVTAYKPLFWLRYEDIEDVISRFERYHPDNTLSKQIWNDYFSSESKPVGIE
jgi:hypothetical protein